MKNAYIFFLLFLLTNSCMSIRQKENYLDKGVEHLRQHYEQKIDVTKDVRANRDTLKNISKKQLKLYLDTIERIVATMPDSFNVSTHDGGFDTSASAGTFRIRFDSITYIKNKNKIKYIKKHNISLRNIILLERE